MTITIYMTHTRVLSKYRSGFLKVSVTIEPIDLVPSVAIYDISTCIGLKVPRRDNHDIVNANPDAALHFATNTAHSSVSIKTSNCEPIIAE
jgi:hypothetical protein